MGHAHDAAMARWQCQVNLTLCCVSTDSPLLCLPLCCAERPRCCRGAVAAAGARGCSRQPDPCCAVPRRHALGAAGAQREGFALQVFHSVAVLALFSAADARRAGCCCAQHVAALIMVLL